MTSWNTRVGNQGSSFYEPAWSTQMNNLNIGGSDNSAGAVRQYYWTINFTDYGKQNFNTAVDDSGEIYIDGVYQFDSGGFNSWTAKQTPGYFAPGSYTISMTSRNTGSGPWGLAAEWVSYTPPPAPSISSFYADPNPQNSGVDGTPAYNTTFHWSSTSIGPITSCKILNNVSDITLPNTTGGNYPVSNLPQSTAGSNSPASRVYTLEICNNGGCSTSQITVDARNDNTPSTTWTTLFDDLEPGLPTVRLMGTMAGVDMTVKVSSSNNNVTFANGANSSFSNPQYFTNGQAVYIQSTSADFNTDVSGLPAGSELGKVNDKTIPVTIGSLSAFDVTYRTRKPVIKEVFDYPNQIDNYPFPDIDDDPNNTPLEFTVTDQETLDDIEIPMEIKTNNPDVQIQINNGNWLYLREI